MSVEAIVLAPLLVVLVLFVVHVGRLGTVHQRLVTIADQAARMASQSHPTRMERIARASATENAAADGLECADFDIAVGTAMDTDPRTVTVEIVCELTREGLGLLAPLPRHVRASSTEVVDRWRADR